MENAKKPAPLRVAAKREADNVFRPARSAGLAQNAGIPGIPPVRAVRE